MQPATLATRSIGVMNQAALTACIIFKSFRAAEQNFLTEQSGSSKQAYKKFIRSSQDVHKKVARSSKEVNKFIRNS